jgi:hypothetical protein
MIVTVAASEGVQKMGKKEGVPNGALLLGGMTDNVRYV